MPAPRLLKDPGAALLRVSSVLFEEQPLGQAATSALKFACTLRPATCAHLLGPRRPGAGRTRDGPQGCGMIRRGSEYTDCWFCFV